MNEFILNLHIHTTYSDGSLTHAEIGKIASQYDLDVIIFTDHNVWVDGMEGYYQENGHRLLMLVGEEIHDPNRNPQKNHLLIFGANRDLSPYGSSPQSLLDQVQQTGGLAFIAHPIDPALPIFGEGDLSWVDWDIHGFTGLELWNGFSEFKTVVQRKLDGLFYAFFPKFFPRGPIPASLEKWDQLLSSGNRVVAVGGSDAHALHKSLGPIHRIVFPYEFHFRGVNNHILTEDPLCGDLAVDRSLVFDALAKGHNFIGYDLPAPTRGFRFSGHGKDSTVWMGDQIPLGDGVTFKIRLPIPAECRLLINGSPVQTWLDSEFCTFIANQPGIYRVECFINYLGRRRGWIFSNPIYVTPASKSR